MPPPPHTRGGAFDDHEERSENDLSLEERIETATAGDIHELGYFRSDAYQLDLTAEQKMK